MTEIQAGPDPAQNTSGLGEAGQNFAGDPDAAAAHLARVSGHAPGNDQFVGRDGYGIVSIAMPRVRMTRAEALCHAAWLVAIADDDDEFPGILAAVRNT